MTTFLIYQLKVAVIMAVFYIFYRLFLIKDSWHRLNRIVLLSTTVTSFILPFCIITYHKTMTVQLAEFIPQIGQGEATTSAPTPWWHIALIAVYAAGVVFVLARVLASVLSVRSIIKNAHKEVTPDGTTVFIMPGNAASFSWMGHIVISETDWNNNESAIIRHEKAHVALHHSIDVLITDLIAAIQWFNPAIWMLRIDLRAVHEYEADDTVLRSGTDIRSYQYLLISKAAAMNGYTIANNFNHSILKNRIFMMEKERTTKKSLLRALYLLPLVCISLAVNAKQEVNYHYVYDHSELGDTTVTSPDGKFTMTAYKIPEGQSIDSLIRTLPGVQVGDDGSVTVNGKPVKRILVNGDEVNLEDGIMVSDVEKTIHAVIHYDAQNESTTKQMEDVIRTLPGAQVDDDGNITINGKPVKKVLVNGKELDDVTEKELKEIQNLTK